MRYSQVIDVLVQSCLFYSTIVVIRAIFDFLNMVDSRSINVLIVMISTQYVQVLTAIMNVSNTVLLYALNYYELFYRVWPPRLWSRGSLLNLAIGRRRCPLTYLLT